MGGTEMMVKGFIVDRKSTAVVWLLLLLTMTSVSLAARQAISITSIGADSRNTGSRRIGDAAVELRGWSKGIDKKSDNCLFAYGSCSGNLDISAHILSIIDTIGIAESGIMVRADTSPGAACIALVHSMDAGTVAYYRSKADALCKTVSISSIPARFLRIKRVGGNFSFLYKFHADSAYRQFPTSYSVSLASAVNCGVLLSSGSSSRETVTGFDLITGLNLEPDTIAINCQPIVWNFNGGEPLATLGFREMKYWVLDTNKFIKTVAPGGADSMAHIRTPAFFTKRTSDSLTFSWDLYADRDSIPGVEEYALFSVEAMAIGDRADVTVNRGLVASRASINIALDAALNGTFHAGSCVLLDNRSRITGDVMCGDTVFLDSQASIIGTIIEKQMPKFPVIATKTITVGSASVTVAPGDSLALAPGNYNEIRVNANAKLRISRGTYNCNRFWLEPDVKLYLVADSMRPLDVNVQTEIHFGDRDKMILVSDTTLFQYVHFYGNQTAIMAFGTDVRIFGYFSLPFAPVILASRGLFVDGGIAAKRITLQPDVQILFRGKKLRNETVTTVFYPNDSFPDNYSLRFAVHRGWGSDTLKDFVFLHRDTIIARATDNKITPVKKWLRFWIRFSPIPSKKATIFYNDGSGKMSIMDSVRVDASAFTSMAFDYITGCGTEKNQVRLDNISVSCTPPPCPDILVIRQPSDTTVYEGVTARFSCKIDSVLPATYQWYKNGSAIPVTNSPVYTIPQASMADSAKVFSCGIITACDTVMTRAATLSVLPCRVPTIYAHPASCTTKAGGNVSFTVNAGGLVLKYRWIRNDKDTFSTTLPVLNVNGATALNNLDEYRVLVTNDCGKSILSNPAVLTVTGILPCKIKLQPRSDTLEEGETYTTAIVMTCQNGTISWFKNGVLLPGMTSTRLIYGPVALLDSGSLFSCIVSNTDCSDTSVPALLVVRPPRTGNRILAISGELFDPGKTLTVGDSTVFAFRVKLFGTKNRSDSLYSETFSNIVVRKGQFTLNCGRGRSHGDLQAVAASNKALYAEVSAGLGGGYEILGPRLPLTAAPYAWSSGIKVIYGSGTPVVNATDAQLGALYVDRLDGGRTWKLTNTGWVKLD